MGKQNKTENSAATHDSGSKVTGDVAFVPHGVNQFSFCLGQALGSIIFNHGYTLELSG